MTMIWIAVALLFIAWLLAETLRRWRNRQRLEEQARRNVVRQAFLIDRIDAIGKVLQDDGLPVDEVERRAAAIIEEMQALNDNGQLTPLIEDERQYVAEQCAARRAGRR
jgi:hypothetical protein